MVGGVATRGTDLTVSAAKVAGGVNGILFNNRGTGNTTITTIDEVIGGTGNGISGVVSNGSGNLTVTAAKTTGGVDGIDARHAGIGAMTVTATGDVTGTSGRGVRTVAGGTTTDTIITVGNTSGNVAGLNLNGSFTGTGSTGRTIVNSTGTASGVTFVGINVGAAANSGDVIINANKATGASGVQFFGIGKGSVVMTVTGDTNGTRSDGIFASNAGANGKGVTIVNSGNATGARFGILGASAGAGAKTMITSTGNVIGGSAVDQAGIRGLSGAAANGLAITASNASGYRGIDAEIRGGGTTNAGTIRNTSGLSSDRAATISGGAARIINSNIFTGTVLLGSGDDIFDNNGT